MKAPTRHLRIAGCDGTSGKASMLPLRHAFQTSSLYGHNAAVHVAILYTSSWLWHRICIPAGDGLTGHPIVKGWKMASHLQHFGQWALFRQRWNRAISPLTVKAYSNEYTMASQMVYAWL